MSETGNNLPRGMWTLFHLNARKYLVSCLVNLTSVEEDATPIIYFITPSFIAKSVDWLSQSQFQQIHANI